MQREVRDRLARATEGEQVLMRINANSLQITDENMATSLLLASGTASRPAVVVERLPSVWISIKTWEIAAGDVEADAVTFLEDHCGRVHVYRKLDRRLWKGRPYSESP